MPRTKSRARTESTRAAAVAALLVAGACRFDPAYRDVPQPPACDVGQLRCDLDVLQTCTGNTGAPSWEATTDCKTQGSVCAPTLAACAAACNPGDIDCQGQNVVTCNPQGTGWATTQTCDVTTGHACRDGSCPELCQVAEQQMSNVGCEYWGVDLDNADVSPSENAAAQQYAIVVSIVQPDVPCHVTVEEDDSMPGDASHDTRVVGTAVIAPQNLEVFKLGPREVDGSADGTFNTGTGTALTRHAYKVTSDFPIVAYQFNPLDNVNVFSNDASQLLPFTGLNTPAWDSLPRRCRPGRRPSPSPPIPPPTSASTCARFSPSSPRATTRTCTSPAPRGSSPAARSRGIGARCGRGRDAAGIRGAQPGDRRLRCRFHGFDDRRRRAHRRLPGERSIGLAHVHEPRRPLLLRRSPASIRRHRYARAG